MASRLVKIGGFSNVSPVYIGGDAPIVVQTMWKDRLSPADLEENSLFRRIETLKAMGCGLLRFAVPDIAAAEVIGALAGMISTPIVADIHFDYKIALRCLDFPIAKLRVNPGNIGSEDKVTTILEKAGAKGIPIRVGVNAGSLPLDLRSRVEKGFSAAEALVLAAERELAVFKEVGFNNVLVSMKASGIADTVIANRTLASRTDFPLHLGVTEAGPLAAGVAAASAALCALLKEGIGDTIRVSLSDTEESEVIAGMEIIRAAYGIASLESPRERLKPRGVRIISCPRCGRHAFDSVGFSGRWMEKLYAMDRDITIAIMGCEVNGPVEAKNADLGVTGAGDKVLIFKYGKVIRTINSGEADLAFEEELNKL